MSGESYEDTPDEELVRIFTESADSSAFEALMHRHESRVYGLAYRMLGNRSDALDATQEVFTSVFRKASSFQGRSAFTTWLYRLATNVCHDSIRRRKRTAQPAETSDSPDPSDRTAEAENRLLVEAALARLPYDQREALVLLEIYGCSYREIAEIAEVAEGTVKSRISRARIALAEILEPPGGQDRPRGRA